MTHATRLAKATIIPLVAATMAFGCMKDKPVPEPVKQTVLVATLNNPGESALIKSGSRSAVVRLVEVKPGVAIVKIETGMRPIQLKVPTDGKPVTTLVPGGHSLTAYEKAGNVEVNLAKQNSD